LVIRDLSMCNPLTEYGNSVQENVSWGGTLRVQADIVAT